MHHCPLTPVWKEHPWGLDLCHGTPQAGVSALAPRVCTQWVEQAGPQSGQSF